MYDLTNEVEANTEDDEDDDVELVDENLKPIIKNFCKGEDL